MTRRQRLVGGVGLALGAALLMLSRTVDLGVGLAIGVVAIAVLRAGGDEDARAGGRHDDGGAS